MEINQTKSKILDAATSLFLKNGIEKTSLAQIAAEADISKGTLYYHFPSKDDLILAITETHIHIYADEIGVLLRSMKPISGAAEMIRAFYDIFIQATFRSKLHIYLINEAISGNENLRKRIVEIYRLWKRKIKSELTKLAPEGAVNQEIVSELLLASLDGWIIQSILGVSPIPLEEGSGFFAGGLAN